MYKWDVIYRHGNTDWKVLAENDMRYWYADPMLFSWKGNLFLFTEAFDKKWQIGRIACSKYDKNKKEFSNPEIITKKIYHLSYPCVFQNKENVFMIPESSQNGTVDIYQAISDDLLQWKKIKTLLSNVTYCDSTIFINNEKIYLFCYEENYKKCLFITHIYSFDIENMILSEIEKIESKENISRPAGYFYNHNGRIYRPVQHNTNFYGEFMEIRHILNIQPYKEITEKFFYSKDLNLSINALRTHTYSIEQESNICSVDIFRETEKESFIDYLPIRKIRNIIFKIKKMAIK